MVKVGVQGPIYPSVGGTTSILEFGLALTAFTWATLSAVTIVGRLGFEHRRRSGEAIGPLLLSERRAKRLVRRASRNRTETGKWRRVAALRTLAMSGHPRSKALLRRALGDTDRDVASAAVKVLGDLGTPWAGEQLVRALREDCFQRSRIATQVERFLPDLGGSLVPLLSDPEPAVRFWGATLLSGCPALALQRLIELTTDADASVRCAAIKALSIRRELAGLGAIRERVVDECWFVRVQACRALGVLGTVDEAPLLARSLRDQWWWVRTGAKDALREFGPPVAGAVIPYLVDEDAFARNGAAEVLQDIGFLDALGTTGSDGRLRERIFAAGGPSIRDAARLRADRETGEEVSALDAAGGGSA